MLRRATSGLELADLWTKAVDNLSEDDQQQFGFSQDDKRAALDSLLHTVNSQKDDMVKGQLMIQRKRGKPIVLRELLVIIVSCVNKFKEVGDAITQYDPGHAALPWAAVRFVLQAAVSEQQIYDGMLEGLEHVADVIARYAWVETLYLHASSKMRLQLQDSIVNLYVAVLDFLAKARRYYSKHTYQRVLKSLIQVDEQAIQKYLRAISDKEEKVNNIARLVDAQYLREISKTMEGGFSSLLNRVDGISQQLADLQVGSSAQKAPTDAEKESVLKWLDAVSTHEDFHTAKSARQTGTCDWILQREEFHEWLDTESSSDTAKVLWLHGKPGIGKTILSARIAEHLQEDSSRVFAFFFCFYGNETKRDCKSIIKAWIAQAVKQDADACSIAIAAHQERQDNFANRFELWQTFKKINASTRKQCYLVDGFDECDRNDDSLRSHGLADAKTRFLTELVEAISGTGSRVAIVSRPDAEIRDLMQAQSQDSEIIGFEWTDYIITLKDTSDDLMCFAQSVMNLRIPNRDLDFRQELAAEAMDKAEGMFLWIKLLHSRLSRTKSPPRLRKIVVDTPSGLDQAYERDIMNILDLEYEERVRTIAILRWTMYAFRPLTIRQLAEALLVELRDQDFSDNEKAMNFVSDSSSDTDSETDEENLNRMFDKYLPLSEVPGFQEDDNVAYEFLKTCGSLIELRGGKDSTVEDHTIHFVHFSVQEYLLKSNVISIPSLSEFKLSNRKYSHEKLTQVCLQYLLYDDFRQTTSSTLEAFDEKKNTFAFLEYASSSWGWHADRCRPLPESVLVLCRELLDPMNEKWLSYSEVVGGRANGSFETFITRFRDSYPSPLFYASLWGIVDCMRFLLDVRNEDVNHVGGLYGTPLKAAIAHGHEDAVSLLLEHGADIHPDSGQHGTAVNTAAVRGQVEILLKLLDQKPDLSLKSGWWGEPPLIAAYGSSRKSVEKIVQTLLDAGASCYDTDGSGSTAVHNFASIGSVNVLRIFTTRGINLDCVDKEGKTSLMIAIEFGKYKAAQFLICHGVNVNLLNHLRDSALHLAIDCCQHNITSLLLNHHAEINVAGDEDSTPLHRACRIPDTTAVKLLLQHGSDHTLRDEYGLIALHHAAESLSPQIVDMLMEHGSDVNARTLNGETPLHLLALQCPKETEWVLQQSAHGQGSREAERSEYDHKALTVIELLLEYGADVETKTVDGETPLEVALG